MATNTQAKPGRQYHQQMVHFLRKSIVFGDNGTELTVGWIPEGALIVKPMSGVHVVTAFNAGTGNVLDVGADDGNDDPDEWGTDLALGTTTFVPLDEAIGTYRASAATEVTCTVALSGTAATTGEAEVVIAYIPDTDG
jgi:hypothetical protein